MTTKTTQVRITKLGYLILYVRDTQKALGFYRDVLGIKVTSNDPGWVEMDLDGVRLALHGCDDHAPADTKGMPEVCFSVDDILATHAALNAAGIHFVKQPTQVCEYDGMVGMSAGFHDPDGNLLSIFGMVKKA